MVLGHQRVWGQPPSAVRASAARLFFLSAGRLGRLGVLFRAAASETRKKRRSSADAAPRLFCLSECAPGRGGHQKLPLVSIQRFQINGVKTCWWRYVRNSNAEVVDATGFGGKAGKRGAILRPLAAFFPRGAEMMLAWRSEKREIRAAAIGSHPGAVHGHAGESAAVSQTGSQVLPLVFDNVNQGLARRGLGSRVRTLLRPDRELRGLWAARGLGARDCRLVLRQGAGDKKNDREQSFHAGTSRRQQRAEFADYRAACRGPGRRRHDASQVAANVGATERGGAPSHEPGNCKRPPHTGPAHTNEPQFSNFMGHIGPIPRRVKIATPGAVPRQQQAFPLRQKGPT